MLKLLCHLAIRSRLKMFLSGTLKDIYLDWRCGGSTGGIIPSRFKDQGAIRTESVHYDTLSRAFRHVPIFKDDVLVDIGCGRGRVVGWWLAQGHKNRIIGIELDPDVADATRRRFSYAANVSIVTGNVLEHLPAEGTLLWMYNPFGEQVMRPFKELIKRRCRAGTRLMYCYPERIGLFQGDPTFTCAALCPGWFEMHGPVYLIRLMAARAT